MAIFVRPAAARAADTSIPKRSPLITAIITTAPPEKAPAPTATAIVATAAAEIAAAAAATTPTEAASLVTLATSSAVVIRFSGLLRDGSTQRCSHHGSNAL